MWLLSWSITRASRYRVTRGVGEQRLTKAAGALGSRVGRCTSGRPRGCAFSAAGGTGRLESRLARKRGRHPRSGIKIFHVNWFDRAHVSRSGGRKYAANAVISWAAASLARPFARSLRTSRRVLGAPYAASIDGSGGLFKLHTPVPNFRNVRSHIFHHRLYSLSRFSCGRVLKNSLLRFLILQIDIYIYFKPLLYKYEYLILFTRSRSRTIIQDHVIVL